MNATDELRKLLNERGVEYEYSDNGNFHWTKWIGTYTEYYANEETPSTDGLEVSMYEMNLTPEQAIAATLEVPEIVRCRDCKHFKDRNGAILPSMVCERWGYYNFKTEPERFCAWAERREQ